MEDSKPRPSAAETQDAHVSPTVYSEPELTDPDGELPVLPPGERYELRALLGEGGMGEVRLCRDRVFGRDVAMKLVLSSRGESGPLRARFVREARVQAQLEHPAIVPVYDFAVDRDGHAFFTMKRVRGTTLAEIIERLRSGDEATRREHRRHALLSAFGRVCLAIDFAHRRGVLHRDLKPANVMLGEWGEVYVLDWGLAKLHAAGLESPSGEHSVLPPGDHTGPGVVLGTPGYMAPEQIRGEPLAPHTDVYALGAILFELLTLEPLCGTGNFAAIMKGALAGFDARPSRRAPHADVAPELEAACVRACALDPKKRFASARELGDLVEAYLSGDRDVELRRQAARAHLARAEEAASRAFVPGAPLDDRTEALREVGRALALEPNAPDARLLLIRMLTEPPAETPAAVEQTLSRRQRALRVRSLKLGSLLFMSWIVYFPLLALLGINDVRMLFLPAVFWTLTALVLYATQRAMVPERWWLVNVLFSAAALVVTSFQQGPLLFVPALTIVLATASTLTASRGHRLYAYGVYMLAFLVPLGLVALDLHPVAHVFDGKSITIMAGPHAFPRVGTLCLTALFEVLFGAIAVGYAARHSEALSRVERASELQLWQLRQLAADVKLDSVRR